VAVPTRAFLIDLHTHLLPGLDDGARNMDETLAIARTLVADGIDVVACTPHVRDDYPTTPAAMEAAVAEVQGAVAAAGIRLEVLPGGELALEKVAEFAPDDLIRFGLGGNPRLLLLEFPYFGVPLALPELVRGLGERGIRVVVAHPERNADVQAHPTALEPVVLAGAVIQVTSASVVGRLGRAASVCSRQLLELELVHLIASDVHSPGVRDTCMSAAAAKLGGGALARWLTDAVPTALLGDDELPARPPAAPRRGLLSSWRR
jgi:protein-tyrosine phosphatase